MVKMIANSNPPEAEVRLWLEQSEDNVLLKGRDSMDREKLLLIFNSDGTFSREFCVALSGIETDSIGRWKESR